MRGKVAVVVPMYRDSLSCDEQKSYASLTAHLRIYPIYVACPHDLKVPLDHPTVRFPDHFFKGIEGYNRLMLSKDFYRAFFDYDYILIFQLDCLALDSSLDGFVSLGYDYIGAPWINEDGGFPESLGQVGNGGLSLRKVSSFLHILESRQRIVTPSEYWQSRGKPKSSFQMIAKCIGAASKVLSFRNNIDWFIRRFLSNGSGKWHANEDIFWSKWTIHLRQGLKIAPPEVGLRFAFEHHPRFCFQMNSFQLPFGCHGWCRFDRAFWSEHLPQISLVHAGNCE
jgi:hypothetical protein